jgi:hypothetical protein
MEVAIIEISVLFLLILYGLGISLFTTFKIGIPIGQNEPKLIQNSVQSPFLVIGLLALFIRSSDENKIGEEIGLNQIMTFTRFLWLPFPVLLMVVVFLFFKTSTTI